MRRHYHDSETLNQIGTADANEAQRPTLEKLKENGFSVVKVVRNGNRSAINMACKGVSGWITPDGKFHRPVKGKKHVSINTATLERIW